MYLITVFQFNDMLLPFLIYGECRPSTNEYLTPLVKFPLKMTKITEIYKCDTNEFKLKEDGFEFVTDKLEENLLEEFKNIKNLKLNGFKIVENFKIFIKYKTGSQKLGFMKSIEALIMEKWGLDLLCHEFNVFQLNVNWTPADMHQDFETLSKIILEDIFPPEVLNKLTDEDRDYIWDLNMYEVVNSYTYWVNVGNDITEYPLSLVSKMQSQNRVYYYENMKHGQGVFFNDSTIHGSLGMREQATYSPQRRAVSITCLQLPSEYLTIFRKLEVKVSQMFNYK
eukprot:NODE_182_length_13754_cov_0.678067.p6 type:complete len:282 gc:universal NODE_182_length_13754_cov_0.678067:8945-8100(-)